jgi:hypothetical protein
MRLYSDAMDGYYYYQQFLGSLSAYIVETKN